jgi:hypothetical protein
MKIINDEHNDPMQYINTYLQRHSFFQVYNKGYCFQLYKIPILQASNSHRHYKHLKIPKLSIVTVKC